MPRNRPRLCGVMTLTRRWERVSPLRTPSRLPLPPASSPCRNRLRQGTSTCGGELQFLVRLPVRKRFYTGFRENWSGMEKNRSQLRRLDFVDGCPAPCALCTGRVYAYAPSHRFGGIRAYPSLMPKDPKPYCAASRFSSNPVVSNGTRFLLTEGVQWSTR